MSDHIPFRQPLFYTSQYEPVVGSEPREGDLRVVVERKAWPQRYRVDWFGKLPTGRSAIKGRVSEPQWRLATSFGEGGYFPTLQAAHEAIEGPKVVAHFRRLER